MFFLYDPLTTSLHGLKKKALSMEQIDKQNKYPDSSTK